MRGEMAEEKQEMCRVEEGISPHLVSRALMRLVERNCSCIGEENLLKMHDVVVQPETKES